MDASSAEIDLPAWVYRESDAALAFDLFVRLLFSALCDGDFLDTEVFHQGDVETARGGFASLPHLRVELDAYLDRKAEGGSGPVHDVRQDVRRACLTAAERKPGAFSLTVPTGGGKTLASMAFALRHAELHGLDRVIVAIPFTSIVEQTVDEYRRVFGAENVVEHHSAVEPTKETMRNRLACENWDAPIVVTTTVQLFESLFANRTSKARKLHSLVRSVIILDEAQVVAPKLLPPIVDVLSSLVRDLGSTLVVSTATQPAWTREVLPRQMRWCLDDVREICPSGLDLPKRLQRVRPIFLDERPTPFVQIAQLIAEQAIRQLAASADTARVASDLDVLRGIEGDASREYFSVFRRLVGRDGFVFGGRSRRPPRDNVNALLSFVYTLLMHDARAALEAAGLDSQVGFLHRDRPGRPSLALDLMEEFRGFLADRLALSLINRGQVSTTGFAATPVGGVVMDDATRKCVIASYQKRKLEELTHPFLGERVTIGHLVYLQALLLARYLRGDMDAYPPFFWR